MLLEFPQTLSPGPIMLLQMAFQRAPEQLRGGADPLPPRAKHHVCVWHHHYFRLGYFQNDGINLGKIQLGMPGILAT